LRRFWIELRDRLNRTMQLQCGVTSIVVARRLSGRRGNPDEGSLSREERLDHRVKPGDRQTRHRDDGWHLVHLRSHRRADRPRHEFRIAVAELLGFRSGSPEATRRIISKISRPFASMRHAIEDIAAIDVHIARSSGCRSPELVASLIEGVGLQP